jgi:tetratricopeptide (TPR) repeat protein
MEAPIMRFFALALALIAVAPNDIAQESKPLHGRLSLPTKNWGVVLDLPGFALKNVETMPDGRRYMIAENESTHVVVSLTLEQVHGGRSAACNDSLQKKAKHPPFKVRDIRFSRNGDFDLMEYIVPEVNGQQFNQRSIYGCRSYDDAYIDLHVSKVSYSAADDPLFASVLNSMHIDRVQRTSMELVEQGSRLYLQHNYKDAIESYSQALELEKVNPKLEKALWYVLIDNLGMSYGITGDLQKAKETFDYGVSKEPTYPLFYYNLACTYAEMNDVTNASSHLKKAYDYKANTLPGESMPDPRTDDSFKKLMKNKEFRELAKSLAGSP